MDLGSAAMGQQAAQAVTAVFGGNEQFVRFGLQRQYQFWSVDYPRLETGAVISMLQFLPSVTTDIVIIELIGNLDSAGMELFLQGQKHFILAKTSQIKYNIVVMPHEPKRRHSRERKGERRSAIHLASVKSIKCPNCGAATLSHHVCRACGYYKGQQVIQK